MGYRKSAFAMLVAGAWLAGCGDGGQEAQVGAPGEASASAPAAPAQAPAQAVGQAVQVEGGAEYRDITVAELQTLLANKDFPLINVHVPFQGDLPDTDASIPFDEITTHLDQLPADKNARIVLYCRSGNMSSQAAGELARLGYTDVYNLVGGFRAWGEAGLPLVGG